MVSMTLCASHAPGLARDEAGEFGQQFRGGIREAREAVGEFGPELVVLFGCDHRRTFAHIAPPFGVAYSAILMEEGGAPEQELKIPFDLAADLSNALLDHEFDVAVCRDVKLDHGFGQVLHEFLPAEIDPDIILLPVNCATPPLPRASRVIQFGSAVGEFFTSLDKRVLFVGTGGLSHNPPSLASDRFDLTDEERRQMIEDGFEAASKLIKPDWDNAFLDAIERWDADTLARMVDNATADAGVGANELRTWLGAVAAGGGGPVSKLVYEPVPKWITGMAVALSVAA